MGPGGTSFVAAEHETSEWWDNKDSSKGHIYVPFYVG